jgi:hypothetical protein
MGIHVVTKFTLTKTTIGFFESVKNWCNANGFELLVDADLFDGGDAQHSGLEEEYSLSLGIKKELVPDRYKGIMEACKTRTGFPCRAIEGSVHIAPDFSLSLCRSMTKRWSLDDVGVKDVIRELSSLIDEYKGKPMHGCSGCGFARQCGMCFALAEKRDGELYVPKEYCSTILKKCKQYL